VGGPLTLAGAVRRARLVLDGARGRRRLRAAGVDAQDVTCTGLAPVVHSAGSVRLGHVSLRGTTVPVELGAEAGARLEIGDGTFVNQGATIIAALSITIGPDVLVGDHVAIYDTNYHPLEEGGEVRRAPVVVERNAWLGRGAVILPGVTVGESAVVAAGAVVTEDVPARTLVAGNPARVVRELRAAPGWRRP
jgi:acetyltransferase-like isoleucine patch superfamily enzyme